MYNRHCFQTSQSKTNRIKLMSFGHINTMNMQNVKSSLHLERSLNNDEWVECSLLVRVTKAKIKTALLRQCWAHQKILNKDTSKTKLTTLKHKLMCQLVSKSFPSPFRNWPNMTRASGEKRKKDQFSDSGFSWISVASCCRISNVLCNRCSVSVALAYLCIQACVIQAWVNNSNTNKNIWIIMILIKT